MVANLLHKGWAKATPHRYSRGAEKYRAAGGLGFGDNARYQKYKNAIRHGEGDIAVVAAKVIERTQGMENPVVPPPAPKPDKGGALAAIGKGIQTAIGWEQQLTKHVGAIPFWKMQALTIGDWAFGLPHGHMHPPNLVPPSTVPICMPSAGPFIKIPILSGADRTKHAGQAAAMCGDMGISMAPWCGGYVPMFEVFFGSAHVWIEGARAARVLCDVVKFCTFSTPKPSDPPLGPMVGVSGGGVNHVGIGGIPLPSFFSLAVGKAFQGLGMAGGKVFRKLTAKSYVDKMLRKRVIKLDDALTDLEKLALERDLYKIASTRTGRQNLKRVNRANKKKGFDLELQPSPIRPPQHYPNSAALGQLVEDALPRGLPEPGQGRTREPLCLEPDPERSEVGIRRGQRALANLRPFPLGPRRRPFPPRRALLPQPELSRESS